MLWNNISRKVTCLSELCNPLYTGCALQVTFLGIGLQSWWSLSPKATYECETDSKQVPWGKHEKDFEKRVNSAWNCWTGSEGCVSVYDRLLLVRAARRVCDMQACVGSVVKAVLLLWCASALVCWSMCPGAWKLNRWVCECCLVALVHQVLWFLWGCICFCWVVGPFLYARHWN